MSTCTFFGHRDTPKKKEDILKSTIVDLIEKNGVNCFYVGNQGNFDNMVIQTLKTLADNYSIKCYIVLAYMPRKKEKDFPFNTILPEGIEKIPRRFAIVFRNKWMIDNSDFVVTGVKHNISSGAAKAKSYAEKKGKTVVNLDLW